MAAPQPSIAEGQPHASISIEVAPAGITSRLAVPGSVNGSMDTSTPPGTHTHTATHAATDTHTWAGELRSAATTGAALTTASATAVHVLDDSIRVDITGYPRENDSNAAKEPDIECGRGMPSGAGAALDGGGVDGGGVGRAATVPWGAQGQLQRPGEDTGGGGQVKLGSGPGGIGPATATPPTLLSLPREAAVTILTYLPSHDIARAAATSKEAQALMCDRDLWRAMFVWDFDVAQHELHLLDVDPKMCYERRLKARARRIAAQKAMRAQAVADAASVRGGTTVALGINLFNSFAFVFSPFVLILAFFIILGQRLDGDVDWSWASVFAPMLTLAGLLLIATTLAFVITRCSARNWSTPSVWSRLSYGDISWAPPIRIFRGMSFRPFRPMGRWNWCRTLHFWIFSLAVVFIPITLVMKLEGVAEGAFPWGAVFVPVWVAITMFCTAGCAGWLHADFKREGGFVGMYLGTLFFAACPLLIILILVAINLDSARSMAYQLVFIPWWMLLGLLLLPVCLGGTFVCFKFAWDRDCHEYGLGVLATLGGCLVVGPPVLTLVFTTLRLQGVSGYESMSWKYILAPVIFQLVVFMIAGVVGSAAICFHFLKEPLTRRWRPAQDVFEQPAR